MLNIVTGQSIRILTTLTPGQVIEIYRTTTDKLAVKRTEDGTEENIFSLLDEDSDLLELAPGDNLLKATADSGETSLQVTVRFYPMVFGHPAGGDLVTLDVLDELTLARLGRVEVWVSLYWDEPYNTEGSMHAGSADPPRRTSLFSGRAAGCAAMTAMCPCASATGATRIRTAT